MKFISVKDGKEVKCIEADINVDLPAEKIFVSKFPSFAYKDNKRDIIPVTDFYGSILKVNTKDSKVVANWQLANPDHKIEITGGTEIISLLMSIGHEAIDPDTVFIGY